MDEEIVNETVDSTNDTEETVETTEEVVDTSEDIEKLKEQNRKLFERAKKAEGFVLKDGHWVKKAQPKPTPVQPDKPVQTPDYITKSEYEEGILRTSKGYSDEDISVLNVIAKGKGISILQAEQDPMFKLHRDSKAEEDRKAKAQLGASKGSGTTGTRKEPATREEHIEMWKEASGR
jgi:hypothetical protein